MSKDKDNPNPNPNPNTGEGGANDAVTVEQLRAELARYKDEAAAAQAALHEANTAKRRLHKVPGTIALTAIDAATGKTTSSLYGIRDGNPNVRLKDGSIVRSEHLLRLAGGTLSDEEKAESALSKWDKDQAKAFLTEMAAIGAGWLQKKD